MSEKLEPALTPELLRRFKQVQMNVADSATTDEMVVDAVLDVARTPHQLAALALHGQPFGFTWEDVDREWRMCPNTKYQEGPPPVFRPCGECDHCGMVRRIAALLPSRDR